jgi:hypothetical protein
MGPAEIASGVSIPGQTNPAEDTGQPPEQRHSVRVAGQLLAVSKGWSDEPRQHWRLQDESHPVRAVGHAHAEGVVHQRGQSSSILISSHARQLVLGGLTCAVPAH